jgi:AcrR family transcriptional regulator
VTTRRRGDELLEAIYEAALGELKSVGYNKFTMEGVAVAAHTGKAALYRRWPDKDALLSDVLQHSLPSPADVALTGDLRTDLLAIFYRLREAIDAVKVNGLSDAKKDSSSTLIHDVFGERVSIPCRKTLLEVLRTGAERGDVRPEAVTEMVAGTGYAMLVHNCMVNNLTVSDEFIDTMVDEVILPLVRV